MVLRAWEENGSPGAQVDTGALGHAASSSGLVTPAPGASTHQQAHQQRLGSQQGACGEKGVLSALPHVPPLSLLGANTGQQSSLGEFLLLP